MVQWEKGKILGYGGSSTVYKCKLFNSTTSNEPTIVAVKEISKHGLSAPQCLVIESEINLLKMISHPNVIQYIHTEYTSNHFYIFLEYAERGSLRSIYIKHGGLKDEYIVYFLRQILSGLLYLHLKGIAHRDIKAANILVTYDGVAKLGDFGSSKKIIMESLVSGIKGTPHFMAPEVIKGNQDETGWFKADIWAIGCLILELHTASFPYATKYENSMTVMFKIASGETPPIDTATSSEGIVSIVNKCCAVMPSLRPPVEDLLNDSFLHSSNEDMSTTSLYNEIISLISSTEENAVDREVDGSVDKEKSIDLDASDEQPLVNVIPSFITRRNCDGSSTTTSNTAVDGRLQAATKIVVSPSRTKGTNAIKHRSKSMVDEHDSMRISTSDAGKGSGTGSASAFTEDALQYTASTSSLELNNRPKAPITGEMLRMGSSENLMKASTNGSANIRKTAREELERNSIQNVSAANTPKAAGTRMTPLFSRELSSNRSMSADVVYTKRNLPPLDVDSEVNSSAITRTAQSAPSFPISTTKIFSPLILASSQTPKGCGRRSFLPKLKSNYKSTSMGVSPSSIIIEESDQGEP